MVIGIANNAYAVGFSGDYAPVNWTFTNSNADGFVNTSNAPTSITLTGGNIGGGGGGNSDYTITATANGTVSYSWNYSTEDSLTFSPDCDANPGSFCDPFIRLLNGTPTILINAFSGRNQSGSDSFIVNAGDTFGFRINTVDNQFGRGSVTISNFSAPGSQAVPEPMTILGTLLTGTIGGVLKKKQS